MDESVLGPINNDLRLDRYYSYIGHMNMASCQLLCTTELRQKLRRLASFSCAYEVGSKVNLTQVHIYLV